MPKKPTAIGADAVREALGLAFRGQIERLETAIRTAKEAIEDGRRGDALKILKAAMPMAPTGAGVPPKGRAA